MKDRGYLNPHQDPRDTAYFDRSTPVPAPRCVFCNKEITDMMVVAGLMVAHPECVGLSAVETSKSGEE